MSKKNGLSELSPDSLGHGQQPDEFLSNLLKERKKTVAYLAQLDNLISLRTGQIPEHLQPAAPRWAGIKYVRDAILEFLEERQYPANRETIRQALIEGGAFWGKPHTGVTQSITFLKKTEFKRKPKDPKIKEINGRIGLFKWAEEKWEEK
jgi:hypothetical protein